MAATKKTAATTPRKPRAKKIPHDGVFYTIDQRSKMFFWDPMELHATRDGAIERLAYLEANAPYSYRSYRMSRVVLFNGDEA